MKLRPKILIGYFTLLFLLPLGITMYIYQKSKYSEKEAYKVINNFFSERQQYRFLWNKYDTREEKMEIPVEPMSDINYQFRFAGIPGRGLEQDQKKWEKLYGDLHSLYYFDELDHTDRNKFLQLPGVTCGWVIAIIQKHPTVEGEITAQYVYPYMVGIKKQPYYWQYDYLPSIEKIVDETFEYYTQTNDKNYNYKKDYFETNKLREIYNLFKKNEFYDLSNFRSDIPTGNLLEDSGEYTSYLYGEPSFQRRSSVNYGILETDSYRVFVKKTQPYAYKVEKRGEHIEKQKIKELVIPTLLVLTLFMLVIIIPISIKERKEIKLEKETLYDNLLRICNPQNFIKPYDKRKVEKANHIYTQILDTNKDDRERLKQIRKLAIQELGVSFMDTKKKTKIKDTS